MKTSACFGGLVVVLALVAGACGSTVASSGGTAGGGATGGGTGGIGGNPGYGGSCEGTTPVSVCGDAAPCPSGQYCFEDMDLTTCEYYGAECDALPDACAAAPTCDCLVAEAGALNCTGDATHGFVIDRGGGDSACCP